MSYGSASLGGPYEVFILVAGIKAGHLDLFAGGDHDGGGRGFVIGLPA